MNWLLCLNLFEKTEVLLKKYDEGSAFNTYSDLLLGIKLKKPEKEIIRLFEKSKKSNPHVIPYLLCEKEFPYYLPESYRFGEEDEAIIYCLDAVEAWEGDDIGLDKLKELSDKKFLKRITIEITPNV